MSPDTGLSPAAAGRSSFIRRHRGKLVVLLFWVVLLGGYQLYAWQVGLSPTEAARSLMGLMSTGVLGGLIYIAFYAASRPVFFPPTLLTISAGLVFGPVQGILFAVLGSTAAALVSYLMGRYFGRGLLDAAKDSSAVQRYTGWMRRNGFESVLLMRLVWAPFDPVSILAGFLRIDWMRFTLATLLGSLPCNLALVLFGASVETDFSSGSFKLDPWVLLLSVTLLAGSLLLSRWLKRRTVRMEGAG